MAFNDVAWFLLPSKDYTVYKSVVTYLKEEQNITDPEVVHLDFHWKQIIIQIFILVIFINLLLFRALKKNMQKHKLTEVYNSDPEVQGWFRKIWSLSMVPQKDIVSTWEKISEDVPLWEEEDDDNEAGEQLNMGFINFLYYFERTWVGLPANKTRGDKAGQKKKAPRYPWSS